MADAWDDTTATLGADDEQARRLVSLALAFSNARTPLSTSELQSEFYPGLSDDNFRHTFRRDRLHLTRCGLVISGKDEGGWVAEASSFASPDALSDREALLIDLLCQRLVEDPSFPYRSDLRMALAKIDRAYGDLTAARINKDAGQSPTVLVTLHRCVAERTMARVAYRDAQGALSTRVLAPYGAFGLRKHTYFVCLVAEGPSEGQVRVFRDDRFEKVTELASRTFSVPDDFDPLDWRRLPFQMGQTLYLAGFLVPQEPSQELQTAIRQYGSLTQGKDGQVLWTVEVSSTTQAARWAIAVGARPNTPDELVLCYQDILKEATGHGA